MKKEKTNIEKTQTIKSNRAIRGGGWYYYARNLRVSDRSLDAPTSTDGLLGFRLVLQTKEKK